MPTLQWSPIQLRLANQQKILPIGTMQGITVDIDGVSTQTGFEVIEINDEHSPYPVLLGINWAIDMNGVINLKQRKMIFEKKSLWVIVPLDPVDRPHYTELMRSEERGDVLDSIYKLAATEERRFSRGYASDSDEEDERRHNRVNEATTLHCNMMMQYLYFFKVQNRELSMYDRLTVVEDFLDKFKSVVPEYQWFDAIKLSFHATPARWWDNHVGTFEDWQSYRCMMQIRFRKPKLRITMRYNG